MNFQHIVEALVATAEDEGLAVDYCNGNPVIRNGERNMGLVASGDYDISFYFRTPSYGPRLRIQRETDVDIAFSCGLDFIYG